MDGELTYGHSTYKLRELRIDQSRCVNGTVFGRNIVSTAYYWSANLESRWNDFYPSCEVNIEYYGKILKDTSISQVDGPVLTGDGVIRRMIYGRGGYMLDVPVENPLYDHPDFKAFMATIIANPKDDLPRLILSDWLEEHGDEKRAIYIRKAIDLYHNHTDEKRREVMMLNDARWHKHCLCSVPDKNYERGFWSNVECGWPHFVENCGKIAKHNPIERWNIHRLDFTNGSIRVSPSGVIYLHSSSGAPKEIIDKIIGKEITKWNDFLEEINNQCVEYANKQALTIPD